MDSSIKFRRSCQKEEDRIVCPPSDCSSSSPDRKNWITCLDFDGEKENNRDQEWAGLISKCNSVKNPKYTVDSGKNIAGSGVFFCSENLNPMSGATLEKLAHLASLSSVTRSPLKPRKDMVLKRKRSPRMVQSCDAYVRKAPVLTDYFPQKFTSSSRPFPVDSKLSTATRFTPAETSTNSRISFPAKWDSAESCKENVLTKAQNRKRRSQPKDTRVQRYAKRVLQLIGKKLLAEKRIREALGNSPDTSKALRLLLSERKLKRFGIGGRICPFKYMATSEGLEDLQEESFMDESQAFIP